MKKIVIFIFLFVGFQSAKAQIAIEKTDTSQASWQDTLSSDQQRMPEFVGGMDSLFSFLQRNTTYPKSAKDSNKQGTVYVAFVVSKTGKVINVKIFKGIHSAPDLDSAAVDVVRKMPNWIPGRDDVGRNHTFEYSIPIKFILQDAEKKK